MGGGGSISAGCVALSSNWESGQPARPVARRNPGIQALVVFQERAEAWCLWFQTLRLEQDWGRP
jgi:hypothetical protein